MRSIAKAVAYLFPIQGARKTQVDKLCARKDWTPDESTEVIDVNKYRTELIARVMQQLVKEFGAELVRVAFDDAI